jgi:hypothetical protein
VYCLAPTYCLQVHSEDLLYSEGEEADAESEGPVYEEDEEV